MSLSMSGKRALICCWLAASVGPAIEISVSASVVVAEPSASCELQEILDRWANALGGRERLAKVGMQHKRFRTEMFGMSGTVEEWLAGDGRHRIELDLAGVFRITQVNNDQAFWLLDQNGKVSKQAGAAVETEVAGIYLDTWSHLLPGRMPGRLDYLGIDTETGCHVIKCFPVGGTETTIYLDPKTFLPLRLQQPSSDGETATTTYSDWRKFGGVLFPCTIKQSGGEPDNDVNLLLEEVQFDREPPPGTFARPAETVNDVHFGVGKAARNIWLDLSGVHIFLQARINDSEPLWFILDTGVSINVIDNKLAERMGLGSIGKVMNRGMGEGKTEVSFVKDVSFSLPGVRLVGQTAATMPLSDILEGRLGRRIDGMFGFDFISRFVVEIDYAGGRLHLYDRNSYKHEGKGELVPIRMEGSQPHCDAVINVRGRGPIPCKLKIDTGSGSAVSFRRPFTRKHDLLTTLPKKVLFTGGFGVGGQSKKFLGRIEKLRIGGLEFKAPLCGFSQDKKGGGASATEDGLLGGRILEQCTVILDYERQRMILEPNVRFGSRIDGDMSGLTFDTGGRGDWHTFTVSSIVEGSPADIVGIRRGDVILSVDGRLASHSRAEELRELFRIDGRTVTLVILRGDDILEKVMVLRPIL
jgi:hypothetical protein